MLARVFDTARKWTPPSRQEKQPITTDVLKVLNAAVGSYPNAEFSIAAAVRDAAILASFTGSRVSEFAQTQSRHGAPFLTVPHNAATGDEGGKPIAFMASDFTFYTKDLIQLEHTAASKAKYLRILFRYTKGVRTFTTRMFASLESSEFCPVQAAARAIHRWALLAPGSHTPVFCGLPSFFSKKHIFLTDAHVTTALRNAVKKAYPDPRHLLHQHVKEVSAHSLRVFACLCLKQANWDEDTISFQLRWDSTAIKYYIRQSLIQVDEIGASLLSSASIPARTSETPNS